MKNKYALWLLNLSAVYTQKTGVCPCLGHDRKCRTLLYIEGQVEQPIAGGNNHFRAMHLKRIDNNQNNVYYRGF